MNKAFRRLTALVLVLVLTLALAACAADTPKATDAATTPAMTFESIQRSTQQFTRDKLVKTSCNDTNSLAFCQ